MENKPTEKHENIHNPKDYIFDIVVEKGQNLPKADIAGRIDGFVVLNFTVSKENIKKKQTKSENKENNEKKRSGEVQKDVKKKNIINKSCQTKAVMNNYNPIWNTRFILHHLVDFKILIELFDYDKASANDYIGKINVDLSEFGQSFVNSPAPLTLVDEYIDQRQDKTVPTELFFSFGKIFTLNKIKRLVTEKGLANVEIDSENGIVIKPLGTDPTDGYFAIKYNDNYTVDFAVFSTDPNCVLYISSEEGYSKKFVATVRREETEEFEVFGKKVKYCMIMKRIPLFNPLALFSLRKLRQKSEIKLDSITTPRGWKGKLSYFQATLTLKDCFFMDVDERIIMDEDGFIVSIKDKIKTSEIAVYPKMVSPYWMSMIKGKENVITLFDDGRKFDDVNDWITSKISAELEYPVIHKDVSMIFYEEDPEFKVQLLVELIPFVD